MNNVNSYTIGLVGTILSVSGAKVEYIYGLNGEKLKVSHVTEQSSTASARSLALPEPITPIVPGFHFYVERTTEYVGGDIELKGEGMVYGKTYKYYFGDGYVRFYPGSNQAPRYFYYSKDHLGNVRSVVTKNPTTNEISEIQQTHYYPFGGIIADLSTGRNVQNRLYNGKELDTSNNLWWYDYGARQYDPTAPRFITIDPHADYYFHLNSYSYCGVNPVNAIDPNGMDIYALLYNGE